MTQKTKLEKLEKKLHKKIAHIEKKLTIARKRDDALGFHLYEEKTRAVVDAYLDKRAKIEGCSAYMVDIEIGFVDENAKLGVSIQPKNVVECTFEEFAKYLQDYQLSEEKAKSAQQSGKESENGAENVVKTEEQKSEASAEVKTSEKENTKDGLGK